MFGNVSDRLTQTLEENGVIESADRELYLYGFKQSLTALLNLITTLVISIFFECIINMMVFTAAYIFIRIYAGGFHAKTALRCYFLSAVMSVCIGLCFSFVSFSSITLWILMCVSVIIILSFAPVEDQNKPLDKDEQRVYGKRVHIIIAAEFLTAAVMYFIFIGVLKAIVLAVFAESLMIISGKIKNIFILGKHYREVISK